MNNLDIYHERHWHMPWTTLTFTTNNTYIWHEQHWHLPQTTLKFATNNIDIFHEQHWNLPWTTLTFTKKQHWHLPHTTLKFATNNIDICHKQHWHLPQTTLTFAMNNTDICHKQHWNVPRTTLTFAMNNIVICRELADVYKTWRKNLILKTTNTFYCKIPLCGFVYINIKLRSSPFCDVRQDWSVVFDVSVRLLRSSEKGVYLDSLTVEDRNGRLCRNVSK